MRTGSVPDVVGPDRGPILDRSQQMTILQKLESITGIDIDGDDVVGQEVEWIEETLAYISDILALRWKTALCARNACFF